MQLQRSSEAKFIIVSISVQPFLSLDFNYNTNSDGNVLGRLITYFKQLGADMVLDMSICDDIALLEHKKEFIKRFRAKNNDGVKNVIPMLASSCPGFVCYAEKTHGDFILPYIANTKSPQQIMGSLVKLWLKDKIGGKEIYHVTVMPCYDKKLEAAREDFKNAVTLEKDVDCVITAIEIQQMFMKDGTNLLNLPPSNFSDPWISVDREEMAISTATVGSASGGYAEYIARYTTQELFGKRPEDLKYISVVRNSDLHEVTVLDGNETLLRIAVINGFKNIQNLVRKLKRKKFEYDYVEVMACPSGTVQCFICN